MNTSSNCNRCHRCGNDLRDTTMPDGEKWDMRTRGNNGEWVVRAADMSGCPVLWCDNCMVGVITEDADQFLIDARAKLFSDLKYIYPARYPEEKAHDR